MLRKTTFIVLFLTSGLLGQAPTIVSHTPTQNALSVPLDGPITVTFDQDMDAATINANTMVVQKNFTGRVMGTYSTIGATTNFTPTTQYVAGEKISISLTTGVQASTGAALGSAYNWDFTTVALGGSGVFATQVIYAVGANPLAVAAADLDGDGDLELVTSNFISDNISVLLNSGDGTYAAQVTHAVDESRPNFVAAADLDGDGDMDLVTPHRFTLNVLVFLNNGDGTFAAQIAYAAGDAPKFVAAADLDGDGDQDLVTNNSAPETISVLLNNGDGTFAVQVPYAAGDAPYFIAAGDFDVDGDLDLVTTNLSSNNVSVLLNNGDGTYAAHVNYAVDAPTSIAAADLDEDGDLDLVTANAGRDNVSVLLNNGDGTYAAHVIYAAGNAPTSIAAADLDGDGDLDLATANFQSDNVSVLLNNGDGTFAAQFTYAAGNGPQFIVAADLDLDGNMDLATVNYWSGDVSVLMNRNSAADLALSIDTLSFRYTRLGATASLTSTIYNAGLDSTLNVTDITSSNIAFTTDLSTFSVLPGDSVIMIVTFVPTAEVAYNDSLTLSSNDLQQPEVNVYVTGVGGTTAPVITSPDAIATTEDQRLLYIAAATDAEDDSLTWIFDQLPTWLAADADSVFGTPLEGDEDTTFIAIVSDGLLSATLEVAIAVTPVNDPPEPFALLEPSADTLIYRADEAIWDTLIFRWEGALDVEGDGITYHFADVSEYLLFEAQATPDTTLFLIPGIVVLGINDAFVDTLRIVWNVTAHDGNDSTVATNGPSSFVLVIDYSNLSIDEDDALPKEFALRQNYPNPFNPVSTLRFDLPQGSEVSLMVYDILGREVTRLVHSFLEPGSHQVQWEGGEFPSGIYIARLLTPEYTKSIKMLLLK